MNDKDANGKSLIREKTIERWLARSAVQYGRAENVDPGDGTGFTVLSYNIGNGMAKPGPLVDLLENETADIVGLQELAVPQAEAIATRLSEKYPHQILVPTGFSGVPPSGPAMPVTARPKSLPAARRIPVAMARAQAALTAPS